MNNFIEFEGKNVDNALEKAGKALNMPVDQITYDVISHGSSGIFGLVGAKKAKIRVQQNGGGGDSVGRHTEARQHARDLVKDAFGDEEPTAADTDDASDEDEDEVVAGEPYVPTEDEQQAIDEGRKALQRIVDEITEGTQIETETKNGRVIYRVEGGNSGLLIGKRGQTLEAIQYLVEKIVNKINGGRMRVLVDVEGYLKNRKNNLMRLATKMADKAKRINKPVTIGQMNAYDRRIVHLHLKETPGVRTQSMGEGYYRKLVIFPKRRKKGKNQAK